MKQADIKGMNQIELLNAFYWLGIRTANETNSRGHIKKSTLNEEKWILQEIEKQFGIDKDELYKMINK